MYIFLRFFFFPFCFSEYNTRKYVFENSREKTHYRETDPKKCAISSVSADRYSQQVNPINPLIRCENPSKRITTNTTVHSKTSRKVIVTRTESDRTANGIRLDGERNPIGRRTESDWTANGIQSDGERNLIGRRTESDWAADGNGEKSLLDKQ